MWTIILTIPVLCIVFPFRKPQILVTYTGGLCGPCILLIFPALLVYYARKQDAEKKLSDTNHNKAGVSDGWILFALIWATITIVSCIIKIV